MPIYEIKCYNCNTTRDVFKGINEPNPKCPNCKATMETVIKPSVIKFIGKGFHTTDYKGRGD